MSQELLQECREYWQDLTYCGCYSSDIANILDKATDCLHFIPSDLQINE